MASAAMASSNARGIFLYRRTFTIKNVAMTKPVVTSHTDIMRLTVVQSDVQSVSSALPCAKSSAKIAKRGVENLGANAARRVKPAARSDRYLFH
jgi:hypothetical protein